MTMAKTNDELLTLSFETKELSSYIATLKRKRNRAKDESEKERLTEEIKMRQFQALFYMEKMENMNRENKSFER
jgi:hypothetical protein